MTDPQAAAQERPLPELPEPRIVSYQTDSVMRKTELRTYDESDMREYVLADRRAAVSSASAMEVLEELVSIQDLKRKHAIACYMANTQVGQLQRDGLAEVDRIATELAKIEKPTWDRARALLSQAKERNMDRG